MAYYAGSDRTIGQYNVNVEKLGMTDKVNTVRKLRNRNKWINIDFGMGL